MLHESCGWLDVSPVSGNSTGENDTIEITINTTGLSDGIYNYNIGITSTGGTGFFAVKVTVDDTPPVTEVEYSGTHGEVGGNLYIGNRTSILLNTTDSGIGGSSIGNYTIHYRVYYHGTGLWTDWLNGSNDTDVEFDMEGLGVGSDCLHYLEYYAVDGLGNND